MTFEQFLAEYKIPFGVLASLAVINSLLAHRTLMRLKAQSPGLLARVGIVRVDWWFCCIRGVLRLGFGEAGRDLPWFSRLLFKGVGFHYAWPVSLMLLVVFGALKIGG